MMKTNELMTIIQKTMTFERHNEENRKNRMVGFFTTMNNKMKQ